MAAHIAEELMGHGRVARGWLGVIVQHLTPELAEILRLETTRGAMSRFWRSGVESGENNRGCGWKNGR
jgi:S1-C subfamily serine protease